MATNNKYSPEERRIASEIGRCQKYQRVARKRWMELDIRINALKNQLEGKYNGNRDG